MIPKWDARFLSLAKFYSEFSKDPSTKVGAVIAKDKRQISQGYNGFAEGVDDSPEKYLDRDYKYATIIHGEKNAILFAKEDLKGATLYTYPFIPCSQCASYVIQSGINRVVSYYPSKDKVERWGKSFDITRELFNQSNNHLDWRQRTCLVSLTEYIECPDCIEFCNLYSPSGGPRKDIYCERCKKVIYGVI